MRALVDAGSGSFEVRDRKGMIVIAPGCTVPPFATYLKRRVCHVWSTVQLWTGPSYHIWWLRRCFWLRKGNDVILRFSVIFMDKCAKLMTNVEKLGKNDFRTNKRASIEMWKKVRPCCPCQNWNSSWTILDSGCRSWFLTCMHSSNLILCIPSSLEYSKFYWRVCLHICLFKWCWPTFAA